MQCGQFLAFLNNMLALDTGKHQSLRAVDSVLFGGGDGVESIKERRAEKTFMNMLTAHATYELGLWKTDIALTNIGPAHLQKICVTEEEGADKGEDIDLVVEAAAAAHVAAAHVEKKLASECLR